MHTLLVSLAISQKCMSEQKAVTKNDSPVLSPGTVWKFRLSVHISGSLHENLCHWCSLSISTLFLHLDLHKLLCA